MTPASLDKAMLLAAGLGTRMRPLTDHAPKPLIEAAGTPLIDYALDRFADAGVKTAIVNLHYRAEQLQIYLQARSAPEIIFSDEREQLMETGGGLKKALPLLGAQPFFCANTDAILIDDDDREACERLVAQWNPETMDALMLVAPIAAASGYDGAGDLNLDALGRVHFRKGTTAPYIFTGLQIMAPSLIEEGPDGPFSTKLLWDKAAARGRLFGLVHRGLWLHVGDPAGLAAAEAVLKARA